MKKFTLKGISTLLLGLLIVVTSCNEESSINQTEDLVLSEELAIDNDIESKEVKTKAEIEKLAFLKQLRSIEKKNLYDERRTARTLMVPSRYETIQEALEVAEPRDIISVAKGSYFGNLNIVKDRITIQARRGVVLYGQINVMADHIKISGFTIDTDEDDGIYIDNSNKILITKNEMHLDEDIDGIDVNDSRNITITNNIISTEDDEAVDVDDSERVKITLNNFYSDDDECIDVDDSSNIEVLFNKLNATGHDDGMQCDDSDKVTIKNNDVTTEDDGFYLGYNTNVVVSGNSIIKIGEFFEDQGLDINDSVGGLYERNTIKGFDEGISLEDSDENSINRNKVSECYSGIYLDDSDDNEFILNRSTNNDYGFYIEGSDNNYLKGNTAFRNGECDIYEDFNTCKNKYIANIAQNKCLNGSNDCNQFN